jgi:transcriptional regulator with XRE-family HTH domain
MLTGLAAQISSLVRAHLAEAHHLLGDLLARLDGETTTPPPPSASSSILPAPEAAARQLDDGSRIDVPPRVSAGLSMRPETVLRRQRKYKQRERERQAQNGTTTGKTAPLNFTTTTVVNPNSTPWPELRAEFHAAIKARHLTRGQVAAELNVSKSSVIGWLWPKGSPPSAANIVRVREWLAAAPKEAAQSPVEDDAWPAVRERVCAVLRDKGWLHSQLATALDIKPGTVSGWLADSHEHREPGGYNLARLRNWLANPAVPAVADGSLYELTTAEQGRLRGYLDLLSDAHQVRQTFLVNEETLLQAAAGEHVAPEVIERVRGVLVGNGAAAT